MVRIETIRVSELEQYLKLTRMERDLQILLTNYLDEQKRQLKKLEEIKKISSHLANFKNGSYASWWKQLSPELKKEILKHGGRF